MSRRKKFIIGISGLTKDVEGNRIGSMGAGKDSVADFLVTEHAGVRISFADPLKRICMEVYEFSVEQLWGSVEFKNAVDKRYPRELHDVGPAFMEGTELFHSCGCCGLKLPLSDFSQFKTTQCYLTPRYAMILLGTEWGRQCYRDTWVNYALRAASRVLFESGILRSLFYNYTQVEGLYTTNTPEGQIPELVAIPDVRFKSETAAIRAQGGKLVRVVRTVSSTSYRTVHPSESELLNTDDSEFDYVIHNDGSLEQLGRLTAQMMDVFSGKILAYDEAQADVPPFRRQ